MKCKFFTNMVILSALLMFLATFDGVAYALSMEQVMDMFHRETGQQWEEATSVEKKNFLRKVKNQEKEKNGELNEKKKTQKEAQLRERNERLISAEQGKSDTVPFHIRSSYESQTGLSWEDATESEQKKFVKNYHAAQKALEVQDRQRLKSLQMREANSKKERQLEKKEIEKKRQKYAKKKKLEDDEKRKKQTELRKKTADLKRKQQRAIKATKSRHSR